MGFEEVLDRVTWLGHSGLLIEGPRTLYFDPFEVADGLPRADAVFLTHSHYDHCSPEDVAKVAGPETVLVGPPDALAKFPGARAVPLGWGDAATVCGVPVTAMPAYTLHKPHHGKEKKWLGFLLELDGVRVYNAGDMDAVHELAEFSPDIAFLPVDNLFTLSPEEAVKAALRLKPKIAVPIHFGSVCGRRADAGHFIVKCRQAGVHADALRKTRFGRPQQVLPALSPRMS